MNVQLNLVVPQRHRVMTNDHVNSHRGVAPGRTVTQRGVCAPPGAYVLVRRSRPQVNSTPGDMFFGACGTARARCRHKQP